MMPSLTIGIPTYNRSACVVQTVQRLLHNNDTDFELVVSDNASDDDTAARLGELSDNRLRIIRQSENVGPTANFSTLLDQASGDYFILHQDDDVVTSDFLAAFFALARATPNLELFATSYWRGNPQTGYRGRAFGSLTKRLPALAEPSTPIVLPGKEIAPLLLLDMPFINPGVAYRTETLRRLGGFGAYPTWGGDIVINTRMLLQGPFGYVCMPYTVYVEHTTNYSRHVERAKRENWNQRMYQTLVEDLEAAGVDWPSIAFGELASWPPPEVLVLLRSWLHCRAPASLISLGWKSYREGLKSGRRSLGRAIRKLGIVGFLRALQCHRKGLTPVI